VLNEESWNSFPYGKTIYRLNSLESFGIETESIYLEDEGNTENALGLSDMELKQRKVIFVDFVMDSTGDIVGADEDPTKFKSLKTGRGPLAGGWETRGYPTMTCYKVCKTWFNYWGLQRFVESTIVGLQKDYLVVFHRKMFCWLDRWFGMSMEDILRLEKQLKADLEVQRQEEEDCPKRGAGNEDGCHPDDTPRQSTNEEKEENPDTPCPSQSTKQEEKSDTPCPSQSIKEEEMSDTPCPCPRQSTKEDPDTTCIQGEHEVSGQGPHLESSTETDEPSSSEKDGKATETDLSHLRPQFLDFEAYRDPQSGRMRRKIEIQFYNFVYKITYPDHFSRENNKN
jgi:hypothetical protein